MMFGTNFSIVGLMLSTDKYILFMSVYGLNNTLKIVFFPIKLLIIGRWLRIIALDGVKSEPTNNYLPGSVF